MTITEKETVYQFTDTIGDLFFEGFYTIGEDKNRQHVSMIVKDNSSELVKQLYQIDYNFYIDSHMETIIFNTTSDDRKAADCAAIFTVIDSIINHFNEEV